MEKAEFKSFAERVWTTFRLIDVGGHVMQKGDKKKLDYLPWAAAWMYVMDCFPESVFRFDEPKLFEDGTGEQWVTVTIIDGDNEVSKRWWLPYLSYTNAPVAHPNAMQINNTRMRVLVKCLAMFGLGTELYTGEDVPDRESDQAPTGVRKGVLAGEEISETAVRGYVAAVTALLPELLADVTETGTVKKIHWDDVIWDDITPVAQEIASQGMLAVAVADALPSWRRSIMRKALERLRDEGEGDQQPG